MAQKHKTGLQRMRKLAGWKSAVEFANNFGLNPGTYTNYEQGKVGLSLTKARDIAMMLGCSIDDIAEYQSPRSIDSLSNNEMRLIKLYRSSSESLRMTILAVIEAMVLKDRIDHK